jgi:signal transduction histidine kinase
MKPNMKPMARLPTLSALSGLEWHPLRMLMRFRQRLLFRGVFLLLALATLALAASVLQQEKQVLYDNYQASFKKTQQQILTTLRHPSGQLALLNPPANKPASGLRPLLLPFAAIDFDDQTKVQQAIAMSDCLVQYGGNGALCVGIGSNPWVGGFMYVAGSFDSADLVPHQRGEAVRDQAHRLRVSITLRGQSWRYLAPFELEPGSRPSGTNPGVRGRLTGFIEAEAALPNARPVKEFRGWIWQKAECSLPEQDAARTPCKKNVFFSLRLPVLPWQDALFEKKRPQWPPEDLDQTQIQLEVLPPGSEQPLLDSRTTPSALPFALSDLQAMLLPGEVLQIDKSGPEPKPLIKLTGTVAGDEELAQWVAWLIRRLPVEAYDQPLTSKTTLATPLARYQISLQGDVRSVNKTLAVVASRVSWFVFAMLLALFLAWFLIEIGIIRRITKLTRRASALSQTVRGAGGLEQFDVSDLKSGDELGILAACLHDLLRRVKEDVEREAIRAEQEKQMWHAVGHEIMSPLQSLLALHGEAHDPSHRYISRMQQAIRVLYGQASPSEAFQSTVLQLGEIDLALFLRNVADNAPHAGITDVIFSGPERALPVRADEYALEDVVTHILHNALRYRVPDSPIRIGLASLEHNVTITIANTGPPIAPDMLDKIFEYGVSDQLEAAANGNRGQGLFVAQTWMAKMGGTIHARNVPDGVEFVLTLPRQNH